jgi:hypothetical protein
VTDDPIAATMARHHELRERARREMPAPPEPREVAPRATRPTSLRAKRLGVELDAAMRRHGIDPTAPLVDPAPPLRLVPSDRDPDPPIMPPEDLPPAYARCTWDTWQAVGRLETAGLREWRGEPAAVLIRGPFGAGTTHLAAAVYRDWNTRRFLSGHFRRPIRWWSADGYVQRLKVEMDLERRKESVRQDRDSAGYAYDCPMLVLDDLGQERATEWSCSEIASLILERWQSRRPTIVTTNLTPEQLRDWEPRVASRLLGNDAMQVNLSGAPDYRRRAR